MSVEAQGASKYRYSVNMRTLCFLTNGDHVLLIHGAPDKTLWAGLYNGIGGHIESGEDIYSACLREIEEETGLNITEIQLCGVITVDTSDEIGVCVFVFRGKCQRIVPVSSAEGIVEWVNQDEIAKLPLVPDLYELLPRVLMKSRNSQPFFAHYSYNEDGELTMKFFN